MIQELYPTEVTKEDRAAGFKLIEMDDPGPYHGEPPKLKVVVCQVGPFDRVIKMFGERGKPSYLVQRFGVSGGQRNEPRAKPEWKPTQWGSSKPHLAVEEARQHLRDEPEVPIIRRMQARVISSELGEGVLTIEGSKSSFTPKEEPNRQYDPGGLKTGDIERANGEKYSKEFLSWVDDEYIKTFQARQQGLPVWLFGKSWETDSLLRRLDDQEPPARIN
jgi:hypothetical protein